MEKPWEQLAAWEQTEVLEARVSSIRVSGAAHHPDLDEVLCGRCVHGLVYRQRSGNGMLRVLCHWGGGVGNAGDRPPDITECTQFDPKLNRGASLDEMVKVAVTVDPREGPPGKYTYL